MSDEQQPAQQQPSEEPVISLKPRSEEEPLQHQVSNASEGAVYAQSAGCVGAAAFGEPLPPHEPVSGKLLVGGASKLSYPTAPQRSDTVKGPVEARPSFANWGQFSSTD